MKKMQLITRMLFRILCSVSLLIYPFNAVLNLDLDKKVEAAGSQFTLPAVPTTRNEVTYTAGTTATVTNATELVSAYTSSTVERIILANSFAVPNAQVSQLYGSQRTRSLQIDGQGNKLSFDNYATEGIFYLSATATNVTFHLKDLKMEKTTGDAAFKMWFRYGSANWDVIFENVTNDTGVKWYNIGWTNANVRLYFRGTNGPFLFQEEIWEGSGDIVFEENSVFNSPYMSGNGAYPIFYDTGAADGVVSFANNAKVNIAGSNGYPTFYLYRDYNAYPNSDVLLTKANDIEGVLDAYLTTNQTIRVDTNAKFVLENANGRAYYDQGNAAFILGNPGADIRLIGNYASATTYFANANSQLILNSPTYFDLRNNNTATQALFSGRAAATAPGAFQIVDSNIGAWEKGVAFTNPPTTPSPFNNVSLLTNTGALLAGASAQFNTMPGGWLTSKYSRIAYSERPVITATDKSLGVTQTVSIDPIYTPSNATISYVSSNPAIASVNASGVITGVAAGTTQIRVTATSPEGVVSFVDISVTVTNDAPVLTVDPLFMELPVNATFTPMDGVTSTDTEDGNLTGSVVVTGTVNTAVPGVYRLDYSVTDSNNNTATATRVVLVNDGTYVVGTEYILHAAAFTKRIGLVDVDHAAVKTAANAAAYKKTDASASAVSISTLGGYNATVGTYNITFVVDAEPATTRTVVATVTAGNAPVITAIPTVVVANVGDTVDPMIGVQATDVEDSTLTITHNGPVITTATGVQIITYSVTDSDGNTSTVNRTYVIQSATEPAVIGTTHVIFASNFTKRVGQVNLNHPAIITAANARAFRLSDGAVGTVGVTSTGTYGPIAGVYSIAFEVVEDNTADISISATVETGSIPTLTVTPTIIEVGVNDIVDPMVGVSATDVEDGTLTILNDGPVNTATTGVQVVTYSVTDSDNNTVTKKRTYVISSVDAPVVIAAEYVLFASDFTKRVSEVDTDPAAIKLAANARAYKIDDGSLATVNIVTTNGYGPIINDYTIEFAVAEEPTTLNTAVASVTTGNLPTISVTPAVRTVAVGDTVNELLGVTANDVEDGAIVPTSNGPVNTAASGVQIITYSVTDSDGNTTTATRAYIILGAGESVVEANGYALFANDFTKRVSEVDMSSPAIITAANARAYSLSDGSQSTVDVADTDGYSAAVGTYEIRFEVSSEPATFNISQATVTAGNAPVLTVDPTIITVNVGDIVNPLVGVSATDVEDGGLTVNYDVAVDTSATGVQIITYTVTDSDANTVTKRRTYIVESPSEPAQVGTTHVLFASDFTKRVGQVDTNPSEVIQAANARAFRLSDGAVATPTVVSNGGYSSSVNTYQITFGVVEEIGTTSEITATVTTGNLPVMTVTPAVVTVNVGDTIDVLQGVVATDVEDGTLIPTVTGSVNTTTTGVSIITYTAVDSDGNSVIEKRTYVTVAPDEPAVIGTDYVIFAQDFTRRVGQVNTAAAAIKTAANVRAFKLDDGTVAAVSVTNINGYEATVGVYPIEFAVDVELATSITANATVTAGNIPTLTVTPKVVTVNVGDTVDVLAGVVAADVEDPTVSVTYDTTVDTSATGVKVITYTATDSDENTVTETRTYVIVSPDEPAVIGVDYVIFASDFTRTISLVDTNPVTITADAQARAFKLTDATVATVNITSTGGYSAAPGDYTIVFEVQEEVTTVINAVATVTAGNSPVISVIPTLVEVTVGDSVGILSGVSATDVEDGALTVSTSDTVDTSQTGVQIVTYSVTDSDGNITTATRTYVVSSVEIPAVIGTDYVIFAGHFIRRVGQVDTTPAAVIADAQARAFALSDGAPATVTLNNDGGYTNVISVYNLEFGVLEEPTLVHNTTATVIAGNEPQLVVTPAVVEVTVGDVVDVMTGVSATDVEDVSLTIIDDGPVNTATSGVQIVNYSVTDSDGNNVTAVRTYVITSVDNPAVIGTEYVLFASGFSKRVGEVDTTASAVLAAANVRAFRIGDGLSVAVAVNNLGGYTAAVGTYTITFETQGEPVTLATAQAEVTLGAVPVLSIIPERVVVSVGDIVDPLVGVSATDDEDGSIVPVASGAVNTATTGIQLITYTATDTDGNETTGKRAYIIESPEAPAIVGVDYVLFASDFTKRVSQVDTATPAILNAANVRAYQISTGLPVSINIIDADGYTAAVGTYTLTFNTSAEPGTIVSATASVVTGDLPTINVTPQVVVVNTGDNVNPLTGVSGTDTEDGPLVVTASGAVNTTVTGVQIITYSTTDSDGNTATATRSYVIQSASEQAEVGTEYVLFASDFTKRRGQVNTTFPAVITAANARAFKLADGSLATVTVSALNGYTNVVNTYSIDFEVFEEPATAKTIAATVTTGNVPNLTVTPAILTVEEGASVNVLLGVTGIDTEDGPLIVSHTGPLDTSATGVQVVTYTVTDSDGNTVTKNRTYVIESASEPAIIGTDYVLFASNFTKRRGEVDTTGSAVITAANARAYRISDGVQVAANIVDNGGYTATVGNYTVTFNTLSEPGTIITAVATVTAGNAPVITVVPTVVTVNVGDIVNTLTGVSSNDTEDGVLIPSANTAVNTTATGVQVITYTVTDSDGNTTTANRTYVVQSPTEPAVVGTTHVIFASDFTKRVGQVNTTPSEIITAANARAYRLSDGVLATAAVEAVNGYTASVGAYTIEFKVVEEDTTTHSAVATVVAGDTPLLTVTPSVVTVNKNDIVNLMTGVSATDTEDVSLTINNNGPLNTAATGVQVVTYTVTDSDGNTATATRTYVIISPDEPAIIGTDYVIFASPFTRRVGLVDTTPATIISAANARAFKISDGTAATVGIVSDGGYTGIVDTYTIDFEVVEESALQISAIATVVSGDIPTITVTPPILTVNVGDAVNALSGVSSVDTEDGILVPTVDAPVSTTTTGVQVITYSVTDSDGNTATATRTYVIVSPEAPAVIGTTYVIFASNFTKGVGQVDLTPSAIISAANARAFKIADGSLGTVTVTDTTDYGPVVGDHTIHFEVSEDSTAAATAVATVTAGNNPVLTVTPSVVTVNVGDIVDPLQGVSATDVEDSTLTITYDAAVNTSTTGIQIVTYSVTDSDLNTVTATRSYIITSVDTPAVIGANYVIFATPFTKRVGQVDTTSAAIITAANARAFRIADGLPTGLTVANTNGYGPVVGNYEVEFTVSVESNTKTTATATVVAGSLPVLTIAPAVVEVSVGDVVNSMTGVSSLDSEDGVLTPTASGAVNTTATGVQVITYSVTDSDMNTVTGTRTYVISSPETPAVIGTTHVILASPFTKRAGEVDTSDAAVITAANARAFKLSDGLAATVNITSLGGYAPTVGVYTIGFEVVDESTTMTSAVATVVAGNLPVLTITPAVMTVNVGEVVNPLVGVSATDSEDGILTVTPNGAVNTAATGVQVINYSATDSDFNTVTGTRTYIIIDPAAPPVIGTDYVLFATDFTRSVSQVDSSNSAIILAANAKAFKIVDGTSGTVTVGNTNGYGPVVGTYDIDFEVVEEPATTISVVASVTSGDIPILTVDPNVVLVNVGDVVDPMLGVSVTDTEDTALTITNNGPVDTTTTGVQIITYSVTDSDNNTVTATRSYVVQSPSEPAVIGTTHVIFASDFTKRVSQVDTTPATIITTANARAFSLSTGAIATVNLKTTNGYGPIVGNYPIEFEVVENPTTTITATAHVVTGNLPVLTVDPRLVTISLGDVVDPLEGVTSTDVEDGPLTVTVDNVLDTTATGVQVMTYRATDSDGNTVINTRTYVVTSADESVIIGTEYVIFASDFTRRVGLVDTSSSAIIEAARGRAYKIADGSLSETTVITTNGYTAVPGVYEITLAPTAELDTKITVSATVVTGNLPVINITPTVMRVNIADTVNPLEGVTSTDVEDGILEVTASEPVDTTTSGVQIITYTAEDSDGNIVMGNRTYVIASPKTPVVIGTEYVIFATPFTRRVFEVDTTAEAIITAANAQAYRLQDGSVATVEVSETGGYEALIGTYNITLEVVQEPETAVTISATVIDNEAAIINVENNELTYKKGETKTENEFLTDANVELVNATNLTTNFGKAVDFNKVGTYVVTLTATTAFTNNTMQAASLSTLADETISTEVIVHIIDTGTDLPATGEQTPILFAIGVIITILSGAILFLLGLLRKRNEEQ